MENPSATLVQQQLVVYSFVFLFQADKGVIKTLGKLFCFYRLGLLLFLSQPFPKETDLTLNTDLTLETFRNATSSATPVGALIFGSGAMPFYCERLT